MTEQILSKIIEVLLVIVTFITGTSVPSTNISTENMSSLIGELDGVGTASFNQVAGGIYRLKSGITSSQTTLPLTGFTMPVTGNEFSISDFGVIGYGTLEPTSPDNKEFVSFTGITQNSDGSATLTGVTRGLNFISDYTASTTLQLTHSGGSRFILSNSPVFYTQFWNLNQNATSTAILSFSSTTPPRYDENPRWTNFASTTLTTKGYADDLAIAGAPDSSQTVKGIVEEATQLEIASSTTTGGTTAPLFIRNTNSTSTPDLSTGTSQNNFVVVSNNAGYLHPDWFGEGIHVSTTTPWGGATNAFEQLGTAPPFVIGDTGTTSPSFWITPKGDVRIATTTESNKWKLAISGTTTTDGFHMSTNKGDGKVLTSNSTGAGTWEFLDGFRMLAASTTIHNPPNSTATGTIFGINLTAGQMGANGVIRCEFYGKGQGGTTDDMNAALLLDGDATNPVWNMKIAADNRWFLKIIIANRNDQASQIIQYEQQNNSVTAEPNFTTKTINTAIAQTLQLDFGEEATAQGEQQFEYAQCLMYSSN